MDAEDEENQSLFAAEASNTQDIVQNLDKLIQIHIPSFHLDQDDTFQICSFGAGDGKLSLPIIADVIKRVRDFLGFSIHTVVSFQDTPDNDFSLIFRSTSGAGYLETNDRDVRKELYLLDNVYSMVTGTDLFSTCLPPDYLHLGLSCVGAQWLSPVTKLTPGGTLEQVVLDEAERWQQFLVHRAAELVPGGYLFLAVLCRSEEGSLLKLPSADTASATLWEAFDRTWNTMVWDKQVTKAEVTAMGYPLYFRTAEELCAPFHDITSCVYKAGLHLLRGIETQTISCPFVQKWHSSNNKGEIVSDYVGMLRHWSQPVFEKALVETRSRRDIARVLDDFYSRLASWVAREPVRLTGDLVVAYVCVQKMRDLSHLLVLKK